MGGDKGGNSGERTVGITIDFLFNHSPISLSTDSGYAGAKAIGEISTFNG